jgi:tetratricopeptide (TPR) repeat protein
MYTKGDMDGAESSFTRSLELDSSSGTAYYYLGLVSYARKNYVNAEEMFLKAFQLGTNAGIINYALGVNSFAAGKNADAAKYLNFAKQADAATFGEKADSLLKRLSASN